jgi:hypothetical protein
MSSNADKLEQQIQSLTDVEKLRHDNNNRLSVGCDLGVGDSDYASQVVELHSPWLLRQSCYGNKTDHDQARLNCSSSHSSTRSHQLYCVSPFVSIVSNSVVSSVTLAITSLPEPESLAVSSGWRRGDWDSLCLVDAFSR